MRTYLATLKHDNGTLRLKITASSPKAAISMICKAEGCPECAIVHLVPAWLTSKERTEYKNLVKNIN